MSNEEVTAGYVAASNWLRACEEAEALAHAEVQRATGAVSLARKDFEEKRSAYLRLPFPSPPESMRRVVDC